MNEHLPLLPSLASSFWSLLVVFVVSLGILYLLLVRVFPLGKIGWKRVDYVWLAVAVIGLLSTSSDACRLIAENRYENQILYTALSYDAFHREVESGTGIAICREFNRTEFSPPNLDAIQKEYNAVCNYYKDLIQHVPQKLNDGKRVQFPTSLVRPDVTDKMLVRDFERLQQSFDEYEKDQTVQEGLATAKTKSDLERSATIIGPLLLTFALAFRVVKVIGEVKIEKRS